MQREFPESDWKKLCELREVALQRFCERVLAEAAQLAVDPGKSNHERYLALFKLMQERDEELADAFNNPRRSTSFEQLARIQAHQLLTDEEFDRFSDETRQCVQLFLEMWGE